MAEIRDRSMTDEFHQGCIDNTYISVVPNRGGMVEATGPLDRAVNLPLQYRNAEVRLMDPFDLARMHRAGQPVERLSRYVPRRDRI